MKNETDTCIDDDIISLLFPFREIHSYGDNDKNASDDEQVKFQAHKGINSDTLACAVEHIIIIDVNLASMNKYLCRTEGTLGYFSARSPFLRNITKCVKEILDIINGVPKHKS